MTVEEINVVLKYNLSVTVKESHSTQGLQNSEYRIFEIHKCYKRIDKKYIYSATLSRNERACYTVEICAIEAVEGYRNFISDKLKQEENRMLRRTISRLLTELKTKKAIYALIGETIDKIKKGK